MPQATTISGVLEQVDYSRYIFLVDPFDAKSHSQTNIEDLHKSSSTEASWRVIIGSRLFDIVKWTTPKRTRSYPLSRTYSLLSSKNPKIALIPIIKDEGEASKNPDVLGIDSIFLLTLFNVYCVISYYIQARKKTRVNTRGQLVEAITDQIMNFSVVQDKIKEIYAGDISVATWNAREIKNYSATLRMAGEAYEKIQQQTGVRLPTVDRVKRNSQLFIKEGGLEYFIKRADERRIRSQQAESLTLQPKERVLHAGKAKVNILLDCDLGIEQAVLIHWAPDEQWIINKNIFCMEKKHNPSKVDITDGLFKNLAFRNMADLNVKNPVYFPIGLTNDRLSGVCFSLCDYFDQCQKSAWVRCENKHFRQYNHSMNFNSNLDFTNALKEGFANKFPIVALGVYNLSSKTMVEIQTSLLEQIVR